MSTAVKKKRTNKTNELTQLFYMGPPLYPSFPYAPWPTTGAVSKELMGDPHSPSDHRKTTLFIPRCLATGGKGHADGHRQNSRN